MELCSFGHEEVCFESGTKCPVCEEASLHEQTNNEVRDLEAQVSALEEELDSICNDPIRLKALLEGLS